MSSRLHSAIAAVVDVLAAQWSTGNPGMFGLFDDGIAVLIDDLPLFFTAVSVHSADRHPVCAVRLDESHHWLPTAQPQLQPDAA
jgi:hypothetical protein